MCNHYRKDPDWRAENDDWSEIRIPPRWASLGEPPNVEIKEHIYPAYMGEFLVSEGDRLAALAGNWRWVPADWPGTYKAWANDKDGRGLNNCRSEYADTTKRWRELAARGRCLIPLHGFYEYGTVVDDAGRKVEHEFTRPDGMLMFAAGLWDRADLAQEGPITTYTMLTKGPGGDTEAIGHHRQPLILNDDELEAYMDPTHPIRAFSERVDPVYTFTTRAVARPPKPAPLES